MLTSSDQDHVLTFYEKHSLNGAATQAELLNHLARYGYQINRVVTTTNGEYVPEFMGKPMLLKTWIPGETLRETEQSDFHSIGESIGALHEIPAPEVLPKDHPYGLIVMPDSCNHGVDLEYETWLADKIAYLKGNFPTDLPRALIHGDLFDNNIIYNQGKFQVIIDFGDACHYTRAYDLGSVIFGACMMGSRLDVGRARGVIEGYQSRISLEAREQGAIQFFTIYAGVAISAWHYRHTYLGKPSWKRWDKYRLAAVRAEHLIRLDRKEFDSLI
jgi:homoserine kinase type II